MVSQNLESFKISIKNVNINVIAKQPVKINTTCLSKPPDITIGVFSHHGQSLPGIEKRGSFPVLAPKPEQR